MLIRKKTQEKWILAVLLFCAALLYTMRINVAFASDSGTALNDNPMGKNVTYLSRFEQLGISGINTGGNNSGYNVNNLLNLTLDSPIGSTRLNYGNPVIKSSGTLSNTQASVVNSSNLPKDTVAADLNGDGIQELIEASYQKYGTDIYVGVYLVDANGNKRQIHSWKEDMPVESSIYNIPIHIAAFNRDDDARDELIVAIGTTVYMFTGNSTSLDNMALTWLETINLKNDNTYTHQSMINTYYDMQSIELTSANVYGDALNEALLINGSYKAGRGRNPVLVVIGQKGDPVRGVELKISDTESFISPNVDIGDVYGTGHKMLVIGGKTTRGSIKYVIVDPDYLTVADNGKYPSLPQDEIYTADTHELCREDSLQIGLKCVSFDTRASGTPESIVLGGSVYSYNKNDKKFYNQDVVKYYINGNSHDEFGKRSAGNIMNASVDDTSKRWLNHVNVHDVITGNFNKDSYGREQVIILFSISYDYNKTYLDCIATCELDSKGKLVTKIDYILDLNNSTQKYPSICNIDTLGKGYKMVYQSGRRINSDPAVLAVLGASPYFEEFSDQYKSLGNAETTYGTGQSSSSSSSNGVAGAVGVSFGFEQDITCIVKLGSFAVKTEIEDQFSTEWSKRKTLSFETYFKSYADQDSVVVMTIPYDVFYYKIQDPESGKWDDYVIKFPASPVIETIPLEDYRGMIAREKVKNAPKISDSVLKHTIGDPRTYPSSVSDLDKDKNIVQLMAGSFRGAGTGSTVSVQNITRSQAEGKSYHNEFSVKVSLDVNVLGVTAGASTEVAQIYDSSTEKENTTMYSGSVAGMPHDTSDFTYSNYNFQWNLVVYDYKEKIGGQEYVYKVVSYLVKPTSTVFPPLPVKNLTINTDNGSLNLATLTWNAPKATSNSPVIGYKILRSESKTGTYGQIGYVTGTSLIDSGSYKYGKSYYYKVIACNNFDGVASEAIERSPVLVNDISIQTAPNLIYNENDTLDLSGMVIRLNLSNSKTIDVPYNKFAEFGITSSLPDKQVLTTKDTGHSITVTHKASEKMVNTKTLKVGVATDSDLTASVDFSVGGKLNATELKPGVPLKADITITNYLDNDRKLLVILAVYDGDNTMVGMSYSSNTVGAKGTIEVGEDLILPANIDNHSVKVLIWDGSDFDNTKQIPLIRTIEF